MTSRRWSNVTKIIVASVLALLLIIIIVTFRAMIPPTIVAFLLAFILSNPVNWIQQRTGWSRGAAVAALYIVLLGAVALTPALIYGRLTAAADSLQAALQGLVSSLQNPTAALVFQFGNFELSLDEVLQYAGGLLSNLLSILPANPVSIARGVTTTILTVLYVLVLNFWLLKDSFKLRRFLMEQISLEYQEDVRRLGMELSLIWSAFLRGQVVLAIVVGSMVWISLVILGVPNAGGLALLAGVMEFLPTVGPAISGTVGTTIALFQESTWLPLRGLSLALVVGLVYAIIGQIESIYLIPRLIGRRVRLHPAITFVGVINGTIVFGLLGVLLAAPVLASVRVILDYIIKKMRDLEPFEPTREQRSAVRIRGLIAGRKIEGIVFDLDGVLVDLDWTVTDIVARLHWLDFAVEPDQRRRIMRRIMASWEGLFNFVITQMRRLQLHQHLDRLGPIFDLLRGYSAPEKMKLLPNIKTLLSDLSGRYRLAVVSTRDRRAVEDFLAQVGLDNGLICSVVTGDDVRNMLPHSEALLQTASQLELSANSLLLVSDTGSNLRSGRAAEMATAGVLTGLGNDSKIEDADLVLTTADELREWL